MQPWRVRVQKYHLGSGIMHSDFFFRYTLYYIVTCIHGSVSIKGSGSGTHPVLRSLALSAENDTLNILEAVNLSSLTVSTKYSLHAEAKRNCK